jgi:tRNA(Ile)-lysidine synthase
MVKLQKVVASHNSILDAVRASYAKHIKEKDRTLKVNVALSGGCDSMALLFALKQLQVELNLSLKASYIDHGLSKNSFNWQVLCRKACKDMGILFETESINIEKIPELGIEGAARELRYQTLARLSDGMIVATAHHENDQAETLLLQLIRGAGLKGLAGMPEFDHLKKIWRPMLKVQRHDIESFALKNHIQYIVDESNEDIRFDRNFLRKDILPKLYERFPHAANTISRSASLIAEGLNLQQSIAEDDSLLYFSENFRRLNLKMIQNLSQERVINLVRWWLERNQQKMPSFKVMQEIYKQIKTIRKDAKIIINLSQDTAIRAYKNELWLVPITENQKDYEIYWHGESEIMLPDMSRLLFKKSKGQGISMKKLGTNTIRIQNRKGGERFKPAHNQPTRTLKYLLQKSKLPPWEREELPMLFIEDLLVAVPSFGVDYKYHASSLEDSYQIKWVKE